MEERNIFESSAEVLPQLKGRILTLNHGQIHRDIHNVERLRKANKDLVKELICKNDAWVDAFIYKLAYIMARAF